MGGRIDLKSHERLLNEWLMIHFQIITRLLLKQSCDIRLFISFFVLGRPLARVRELWTALTSDQQAHNKLWCNQKEILLAGDIVFFTK
jgi:hypothetical protein